MRRLDAFHMKAAEQNASSLALYIGRAGALRFDSLSVDITVADSKRSYGRTLLLVRPVSGTGEQWVEESRIAWTKAGEDLQANGTRRMP
ncbi:MAG TPA: hypothetical protein VFR18_18545 [Terriglobia bacterium]|nr:hypothetical protein [Terriglobia bacterium]